MCSCDYDQPSAFWASRPKARKRHKCSECRGWIEPGEVYSKNRGIWDGEPSTYAICADCEDLIRWAGEHDESGPGDEYHLAGLERAKAALAKARGEAV